MSIALREPPDLDRDAGGIVARRAVIRWGWRLFRREWRQQLLVLGLLTVAVAAAIWGTSVVTNSADPERELSRRSAPVPRRVTLPGSDPQLAADIAAIAGPLGSGRSHRGARTSRPALAQSVQLRAEGPHGHYNAPLLGLVSGMYPAGPGQVALTSRWQLGTARTWAAPGTRPARPGR